MSQFDIEYDGDLWRVKRDGEFVDCFSCIQEATDEVQRLALRPGDDGEPVVRSPKHRLALDGEREYVSLARNRSGQDSGNIDYRIAVAAIDSLHAGEKAELLKTARAMVVQLERYCGNGKHELDSIMSSDDWNVEWWLGVDQANHFFVVNAGMPIGVQVVASGSTALEACRNAIARKLTTT